MARRRSAKVRGDNGGAIVGGIMILLAVSAMIGTVYILSLRADLQQINGEHATYDNAIKTGRP